MMRWIGRLTAVVAALALTGAAMAQSPGFDPHKHRRFAGPPSEVLVLGTPHLSGLPQTFKIETLAPVLDRLAAWRPQIITIEGVSGVECDMLGRHRARFGDAFDSYCWDLEPVRKATGLDVVAANAEVARLLAGWPANPSPAQRRHLAMVFIAAGERASALVQWLRLPAAERHEGDGLDAGLVEILRKCEASRNENYALAAVLAARLGLERVHSVDDHTADGAVMGLGPSYEAAIMLAWSGAGPRKAALAAEEAKLGTPAATLGLYRYHNRPQSMEAAFTYDFGAALNEPSPEHYGRTYVGWWETRNLRMVANIRAAMTPQPGARVLVVVGSSHKGYFDAYLGMMHDVRIANALAVLR
jgi:hypothetical protein